MNENDLNTLEECANDANQDPWSVLDEGDLLEIQSGTTGIVSETFDTSNDPRREVVLANMHYMAMADPRTVLALIQHIRSLKEERDGLAMHLQTIKTARRNPGVKPLEKGLAKAIDSAPLPSLLRRDDELQATLLERAAESFKNAGDAYHLIEMATERRERAANNAY